ncbi:nicotinate phosphoribosyltransferase [Helicobacter enhydrae]|uniref:Nicotinate phosphoribosyltransferase n=1 Tax=Helicobacter enhydrae TaxID=222136 RepID=A0A1B1U604_9HELI|nr:phosphoribosyltransferase family protein [Helicobacter enhydrae]ANV98132.1 nicotinate phosphoribosyltransferase [Helicobacter enhydrae]
MKYYSYQDFLQHAKELHQQIDTNIGCPDAIIAVARGGLTLAHFLSLRWDLREVYMLNAISYNQDKQGELVVKNLPTIPADIQKVLIVDEIVDSGKSLQKIVEILKNNHPKVEFYTATIFQKTSAIIQADFSIQEPTDWIDFFWERDMF